MGDFVQEIRAETALSDAEIDLIYRANIASSEALLSLTLAFPTELTRANIDVPKLSFVAGRKSSAAFAARASASAISPKKRALGARPPTNHPVQPGYIVPATPFGFAGSTGKRGAVLRMQDYRLASWPVRDQGKRGTCVAHALVACREFALGVLGPSREQLDHYYASHATDPGISQTKLRGLFRRGA